MVNNNSIECLSRDYRSDSCPWKFDVLKTSIFFFLEASLLGKKIVLIISNFRGATISR